MDLGFHHFQLIRASFLIDSRFRAAFCYQQGVLMDVAFFECFFVLFFLLIFCCRRASLYTVKVLERDVLYCQVYILHVLGLYTQLDDGSDHCLETCCTPKGSNFGVL